MVVGAAIKRLHGLTAEGREEPARLHLLMAFPELTPRQIDLIITGRNCRGEEVRDKIGIVCRV
ncbi:MAG: hypothetical protein WCC64_07210 [Aliidongia sp.]